MKAQVTIEFLSYSIIFLIVMGGLLGIIVLLGNDQISVQKANTIKGLANEIVSAVVFTLSMGKDFTYTMYIDKTVNGAYYNIYFRENSVDIEVIDQSNILDYFSTSIPLVVFEPGLNAYPIDDGVKISTAEIDSNNLEGKITLVGKNYGVIEVNFE